MQITQLSLVLSSVLISSLILFLSFIKWPNVCFFALWHCWHYFGSPDPLCEMFTVIVLGYLQQAHCSIHFLVQQNNKQTAKRMAAKSGKLLTVTVKSNHPSSSSNSPHLSHFLSLGVFTSLTLLSQSPFPHGRGLSVQSVCSGCVWPCMNVHFVIVSQWVHVGHIACCPCVMVLTWLQTNLDVSGRGPASLPLSANRQLINSFQREKKCQFLLLTHTHFYIKIDIWMISNWIVWDLSTLNKHDFEVFAHIYKLHRPVCGPDKTNSGQSWMNHMPRSGLY